MPMGTPADPGTAPQTDFSTTPSYIPNNVIVLTFDDVPGTNAPAGTPDVTGADLQFFKSQNMHVDFFINTNNYGGPTADIVQMQTDGHYLGNHTIHHWHLGQQDPTSDIMMACKSDPTCVDSEVGGNETAINTILGGSKPHLTRFRAPFGEPYQGDTFNTPADLTAVSGVVAKYAVTFNWNFDSGDSNGMMWTGATLLQNIVSQIGASPGSGSWGIMLAHGVYAWTRDMLPMLIPYLQQNGFVLGTLEDVSCWLWGKHTWDIIPNRTQN
jgi:peptidoglycan/xylan/chitin deacetylase (PgdA/CDA1 family)